MTRCLSVFALAFGVAVFSVDGAAAQSTSMYAQNQLNAINARNSASFYTGSQFSKQVIQGTVPTYGFSKVNNNVFTAPKLGQNKSKPFSNFVGQGSVTPWLALSQPFTSPTTNYFSNVRPQLDQQRANQQMASRNAQLQRQLNTLAAQAPYNPAGSENMAPTGHAAAYMNYGGYYTPVQPTKQHR
jgi:hypothetical protein